ncbi:MAG: hypothetical protein WAJ85_01670, partial [Candidatus Baltobacteraceae bacterium]
MEQPRAQGRKLKPGDGDEFVMKCVAHGFVIPPNCGDADGKAPCPGSRTPSVTDVDHRAVPPSPEAELLLYQEFDVTDDPRPGIFGERHDSTRDLPWVQGASDYYDRAF